MELNDAMKLKDEYVPSGGAVKKDNICVKIAKCTCFYSYCTTLLAEPNFLTHTCKRTLSNVHNLGHLGAGYALVAGGV
jgi:hypothetical protein